LLEQATKSADAEVARRATDAVAEIKQHNSNAVLKAGVRRLTRLKPANATEVLLEYLGAADAEVEAEVLASLASLAQRDGKSDPVLERALKDKNAKKRAAAEAALGKDGGAYLKKPGRRLYSETCRMPAKATILVDGKTVAEIEFVDVQFFNRLDDAVFAKP
jgi:chorismate mutase